ncbi:MAG: hypothetical protein E7385_03605 [Ruminococcaceae bacterium]|nr:hypothetical protein [Oscillospiraceae bacterium]
MKSVYFDKQIRVSGYTGKLSTNVIDNFLLDIYESNPAILDIFHERDIKPYRDLLPWSGEFAGKYLLSSYYLYKFTGHEELYNYIQDFIKKLISLIDEDGYLGCFQKECRMTGAYSQSPEMYGSTWDAWSHYYIMYGLYLWNKEIASREIKASLDKIVSFFTNNFYKTSRKITDMGSCEMNMAPIHIFMILYCDTKEEKYLSFAKKMIQDMKDGLLGDYIECLENEIDFNELPNNRWEFMPVLRGLYEIKNNGEKTDYKKIIEKLFYNLLMKNTKSTGGFFYNDDIIELCSVVAFLDLACDIFLENHDLNIADFLELAHYNAVLGSFSSSGRWSTYNTPITGQKISSCGSLAYQSRPGSPELNSCSVGSGWGLGMPVRWMITESEDTLYVNYYENFTGETKEELIITTEGDYLQNGTVTLSVNNNNKRFIALRIPAWTCKADITVKFGEDLRSYVAEGGKYFIIGADCHNLQIEIDFHNKLRIEKAKGEFTKKHCVYFGPVLYGVDQALNEYISIDKLPVIKGMDFSKCKPVQDINGRLIMQIGGIKLCDFAHIGSSGSLYTALLNFKKE